MYTSDLVITSAAGSLAQGKGTNRLWRSHRDCTHTVSGTFPYNLAIYQVSRLVSVSEVIEVLFLSLCSYPREAGLMAVMNEMFARVACEKRNTQHR